MNPHPNATAALSGAWVGALIVWILELAGVTVTIPEPVAVGLGGVAAAIVLGIGRRGITGIARMIWRGSSR